MSDRTEFTTDDIALAVEIPGLYDGAAVFLLKSGEADQPLPAVTRLVGPPHRGRR